MKKSLLFSILLTVLSFISFETFSQQITAVPSSQTAVNPKLKLGLSQVVSLVEANQVISAANVQNFNHYSFKDDNKKILVDVVAKGNAEILQNELSKAGIEVIAYSEKRVTCWLEINSITSIINKSPNISWIQPVLKPINNSGPVQSQGDAAQRSDIARQTTGLSGTNVKVGVLSDSYNNKGGAAASVTAGELPGAGNPNGFTTPVTVLKDMTSGGTDEGRAMLEIIHDVAPGAQLYYYTAFVSEVDFAAGIRALAAAGCKVIIDDVGYFAEPYFQDGIVAQAVDDVTTNYGVSYYSSAGNAVDNSYEAPYLASSFANPRNPTETAHNFGTVANPIYFLPVGIVNGSRIGLQWDDAYFSTGNGSTGATSDLNFYLFTSTNGTTFTYITSSEDNNIGDDPFEFISVSGSGTAYLMISKKAGTNPRNIKFIAHRGMNWNPTPVTVAGIRSSTTFGHANAAGAMATGAASYDDTPAFGTSPPVRESFSSKGGTPIYRSTSGVLLPSAIIRPKPEIVAPDNGNTSFFFPGSDYEPDGHPNFAGTSAAAPHAGAVAALMFQGNPGLTPNAIKTALINSCVDMDDPNTPGFDVGFDYATGNGLIKADAAVLSTINPNCPTTTVTITRPTTFCEGDSVILDAVNGSGYTFQWKRDGADIPGATNARLIVKQTGLYLVVITHIDCTVSSIGIVVNAKLGVPVPTTISRTITAGTTITPGNGLQASSLCPGTNTSTYAGPTIGYDGGTKSGADPQVSIAGAGTSLGKLRVSITWRKRSGGTINDCGTTGGSGNPFNAEISFKIVSPNNTTINLLNTGTYSNGGTPAGLVTTVFEDGGSAIGTVPASGTFAPAQSLYGLNGTDPNGVWKLLANDSFAADPLCVESFSVTVYTPGSGGASTITWWTSQTGGSQVGSGTEYIPTDTNPGVYNYYAQAGCVNGLDCQTSIRKFATLTITSGCVPQGGAVTADATVCSGNNAGTLTLAGHNGTVLRWESSTDNFVNVITPIVNTTTSQIYTNLTTTTQFRAVVQNGSCPSANSTPATITVTSASVGGAVTADANVCSGSNSGTLTLSGHTGNVIRWEYSTDNFGTSITPIANTTTSQNYLNLTQTTQFRAVVQAGSCAAVNSSAATITIIPGGASVGGAVTADAGVCAGNNSGTLTLGGHTGSILRWESSTDNFGSVITPIVNTTTSQNYLNLTQTTQFRAVVQNGSCPSANSSPATITVTTVNATASNTGPYTVGQTIQLTATGGGTYSWNGPNSFTSTSNPATIPNATVAMSGIYTVTVTLNSCTATATTSVTVDDSGPCSRIVDYDYVQAGNPFVFKFPLVNNMVIAEVPEETSILVNPICPNVTIESFRMQLQGPAPLNNIETIESIYFYALFNNTGDMILGRHFIPGSYTLTITGYSLDNAEGSITYGPVITNFTVVPSNASIGTPTFSVNSLCAGSQFTVNFTATGTFDPSNQFQVQLSDQFTSFDNPVVIGTSATTGNVICTIPTNIVEGTGYKIRVVSTYPTLNGNSNGTTLTLNPNSLALVSPTNDFSSGTTIKKVTSTITASNKVFSPANVSYQAGNSISLNPGFQANSSAVFKAEIKGCDN